MFISCKNKDMKFTPIGHYETPFDLKSGAPRQGSLMPDTKGKIILHEAAYIPGLKDLSDFEYIWVIYVFDKAEGWEGIVRPPESHHSFGVFATRSPRRPNPIGLSLNKLDSIKGHVLYVSGIDVFNGTPVLDIKPFLPSVDYVKSKKNERAELLLGHHDEDFIDSIAVKEFVKGENANKKTETFLEHHHHVDSILKINKKNKQVMDDGEE